MVTAKRWTLVKAMEGMPALADFRLEEQTLPPLQDGEILCEAVYLSLDPYTRLFGKAMKPGDDIVTQQVARVIESKCVDWPVGSLVAGFFGWRTHTIVKAKEAEKTPAPAVGRVLQPIPDSLGDLSPTLSLGVLGMPGATAYFGTTDVLGLRPGETLFVDAAAGAVGSIVGQIGKILGCTVIGCAGTEEKCDWLKCLGFDHVFNYKTRDFSEALTELAPDGLDCFFDNVGGHMGNTVIMNHMREYGRIAICGFISMYNEANPPQGPYPFGAFLNNKLTMRGFTGWSYYDKYPLAFRALAKWIKQGQLGYKEHVTEGFDKMPQTFLDIFKGSNFGKSIIKV